VRPPTLEELKEARKSYSRADLAVGEPTINPELVSYVKMLREAGFEEIEITTNGRMLSVPGYAEKLARAGIKKFKISIHGSNPLTHDALTRTPGSFKQTIRGLREVSKIKRKYGLTINILTTITKLNYKDIPDMVAVFLKYPVDALIFNVFDITGEATRVAHILAPKYSDVEKTFYRAIKKYETAIRRKGVEVTISLPLCILRDEIKKHYGNYELIVLCDGPAPKASELRRGRVFIEACKECSLQNLCDGVWENYIRLYGDSEFVAQKIPPQSIKKERPHRSRRALRSPQRSQDTCASWNSSGNPRDRHEHQRQGGSRSSGG